MKNTASFPIVFFGIEKKSERMINFSRKITISSMYVK